MNGVRFDGRDIASIGPGRYRNKHAATVFQQYNLRPYMTALQKVVTAMAITGTRPASGRRKARALDILAGVGLDPDAAHRDVLKLSGGQQQRVAVARALACDVDILFADEPTGNSTRTPPTASSTSSATWRTSGTSASSSSPTARPSPPAPTAPSFSARAKSRRRGPPEPVSGPL
ncbi:ATP-binding cassette domain-containing protein [Streptomyces sp. NPDC008139]|uniref:ATP-binding cassette domain-containing protein n=1 Tax=Streptomyces sp. NPDC008139 TaxID=3364814 RepID=UPI0036E93B68